MEGATFCCRYAVSTESSVGEPCCEPAVNVAFHCTKRAQGAVIGPPSGPLTGFDHGLQFCCGLSRFPERADKAIVPPWRSPEAVRRPQMENPPVSNTSLSLVPSDSMPGPTRNTFPTFPVAAYSVPPLPGSRAVTCATGKPTSVE